MIAYLFAPRARARRPRTAPLLLGACAVLAACGGEGGAAAEAAPARSPNAPVAFDAARVRNGGVRWTAAETREASASVEVPGQLEPNGDRAERLSAPALGRVLAVHVQLGQRVGRGQPLVTLASQEASAARADFEKAVAELNSRRAAAAYARTARERADRLLAAKAISRQDLERAQADDELARASLSQAQSELLRARATLAQLGVGGASGSMVLRAPFAGVVLSRDAEPGSVVQPGALLVSIADPATLWLTASVADRAAAQLRPGSPVRFSVPAFPADTFRARVLSVGSALDADTRTVPVRAEVANADVRLRPQMFATVWIDTGDRRLSVVVPDEAVQLLERRPVLFVAVPDGRGGARFARREVEVGATAAGQTQILSGVNPGELVVTQGAFAVKSEFARAQMAEG